MKPPIPKNEAKRLNVLWQYDILDTVPEEVFDELAELASHICEAPVALITLVDEKRQWFKARVGTSARETSRDISFCAHAMLHDDLFIVSDASKDPRFKKNPLVTGKMKVRFYAGAPLKSPDGYALGTLCVVDSKPRVLREEQKKSLRILARHVETQLELRRHAKELAEARQHGDRQHAELARAHVEIAKLRGQLAALKSKSSPRRRSAS
jgi:GAF domain-containing protein